MLQFLDLFSGIGGFALGLERAGHHTAAFCELEPAARDVLAKHWPEVPLYDDVRTLSAERLAADGVEVNAICGGFPCQDLSRAGSAAGLDGERSGLWSHYARLIGELRPRIVVVENVTELLGRGLGRVLGDLASLGYDAEWHRIPASSAGAPHPRERLWIVAYPHAMVPAGAYSTALGLELARRWAAFGEPGTPAWWAPEPAVGRVVDGLPSELDRLRVGQLGNAVVPQIPELIGRAILAAQNQAAEAA